MNFFHRFIQIFILWQCYWQYWCWSQSQAYMSLNSFFANYGQSRLIQSSMDLKVNPCNNFYDYACGNWDKTYAEAGRYFFEPVAMINRKVNEEMHQLLDQLIMENKPKFIDQVQKYYISCTNIRNYKTNYYIMWLQLHDQFEWATSSCTCREKIKDHNHQFDWVRTLAKMRTYDFNDVFIQLEFINKVNDVNSFIIDLNKPDNYAPLSREEYDIILKSIPVKSQSEGIETIWQIINKLEESLAELNAKQFESKSVIKFKDLPLDWLKNYLRIVLNQTVINPDMELYIQNISYLYALDKLLQNYDQHLLNFYLEIRFLVYLFEIGPNDFSTVDCLSNTRRLMPTAMHWLYEFNHKELYGDFTTIFKMYNKLRSQFRKTIDMNKHGFDFIMLKHLRSKLHFMKLKINNIPRVDTVTTLEKFYKDLDLNETDFYGNHLKLLRFNFNAQRTLLYKSKTILDFTYLEDANVATGCSPYYRQDANTIYVPLSILQPPLYHAHLDDIYKYSCLGFLIGHEMFHAFDESGLLKDAFGNGRVVNFKENNLFNASFNCLIQRNPMIINEKIADISGLHYAYHAYFQRHPEALNRTVILHGNEMPLTQVFFLNFAQFFCGSSKAKHLESMNEHGSDRDRLMDAVDHFPEFAKAFQCTPTDHHYRLRETCRLW